VQFVFVITTLPQDIQFRSLMTRVAVLETMVFSPFLTTLRGCYPDNILLYENCIYRLREKGSVLAETLHSAEYTVNTLLNTK
jgi:hypothetical protein